VKLVVQPEAEADIVNSADWYDDQSRSIRQKFLDHVENALYIASDSEVNVIACSHCSRDPKRWQKRLRK
jgi:hypothetical protein